MKSLKKAKIVNLNINSKANPVHHLFTSHISEQRVNSIFKQEYMLNSCYEAIKIIANDRIRILEAQKKAQQVPQKQTFKVTAKTDKQNEVRFPLSVAQTIEVILKRFITAKVEEGQSSFNTNSQYLSKKKSSKGFLLLKNNKQNSLKTDDQDCFRTASRTHSAQKWKNKIKVLQGQLCYYKQKLSEQTSLVGKLESRQIMLKKKFHEEATKIIRGKNILNIHEQFGRQCNGQSRGRYLLNINGKNFNSKETVKEDLESTIRSSYSSKKTKKTMKDNASAQKFNKYEVRTNLVVKNLKDLQKSLEQPIEAQPILLPVRKNKRARTFLICSLKQQIQGIKRQKERLFDELTTLNQEYQDKMDQLDQDIIQKLRSIRKEEQLLSDDELKMLKQEDFNQLEEMCGFYDNNEDISPNQLL